MSKIMDRLFDAVHSNMISNIVFKQAFENASAIDVRQFYNADAFELEFIKEVAGQIGFEIPANVADESLGDDLAGNENVHPVDEVEETKIVETVAVQENETVADETKPANRVPVTQ